MAWNLHNIARCQFFVIIRRYIRLLHMFSIMYSSQINFNFIGFFEFPMNTIKNGNLVGTTDGIIFGGAELVAGKKGSSTLHQWCWSICWFWIPGWHVPRVFYLLYSGMGNSLLNATEKQQQFWCNHEYSGRVKRGSRSVMVLRWTESLLCHWQCVLVSN